MTAKPDVSKMPDGFVSPFTRVQMEERIDDALACIATLANQPLQQIKELAVQLGLPKHGPYWVDNAMIAKLLFQFGYVASDYKEVAKADALPYVALLMVDYDPKTEIGRHVVWHHVRGSEAQQAFSYVLDPAPWIQDSFQVTRDLSHLKMRPPLYYIEVTPRPAAGGKKGDK